MPSRYISLLQIGDVHLPEHRDVRIADDKDKGFPKSVLDLIAPRRLEVVAKSLLTHLEPKKAQKPSAIIISGDLTSFGDLPGYKACVEYLCKILQLKNPEHWLPGRIHVVPGNHDIDRGKITASADLYKKFEPLERTWTKHGLNVFVNSKHKHTPIEETGKRVDLFSLNSCLGCGAKDYLPGKIREQLNDLLKSTSFDIQSVQLDTPAFDSSTLAAIKDDIDALTATTLPIITSHHNILPQAQPRIELYTEAINGGLVRSMLSTLGRPVIYCHGHLHKDPIEIITSPKAAKGRLVAIAAPLLSQGYNLIEIHFSRSGIPIGCIVKPYRLGDDGMVQKEQSIRIPLQGHRDSIRTSNDGLLSAILDSINSEAKRFNPLRTSVQTSEGLPPTNDEFIDLLLELEWSGLIMIADRKAEPIAWQIYRNDP